MSETPQVPAGPPATPRWVKRLGVVFVIAILIVVIVMVVSGGQHGPGMHAGAASPGHHDASMRRPISVS